MSMEVSALLLAAGTGTRLKPLTDIFPKCLMPINNRPLLGLWLEMLEQAGIDDVIINTHYLAPLVERFIKASPYEDTVELVNEKELLGTAGTLLANYINMKYDTIMLVHADNLSNFDVNAFLKAHEKRPRNTVMTMMTFDTDRPQQSGIVELDGNDVVTGFFEKMANPLGTRANAAVYLIDRAFIDTLDKNITDFSTQVLPHLMGKIYTWHNDRYHLDIGTPAALAKAQRDWPKIAPVSSEAGKDYWYGFLQGAPELAKALKNQLDQAFKS